MGIRYESSCNGCPECIGCHLGSEEYPVFFCDSCHEEMDPDDLYDVDDEMLCKDCLADGYHTVKEGIKVGKFI